MSYPGAPGDPAQPQPEQPIPPAYPPPVPPAYGQPEPGRWPPPQQPQPQPYTPGGPPYPPSAGPPYPPPAGQAYPPGVPAYLPYPSPGDWPQQKQKSRTPWIIATAVLVPVLLLGCFCLWGLARIGNYAADSGRRAEALRPPSAAPSDRFPTESAPPPAATGPRASTYAVREDDDLNRVCDGWFYPQSPKFTGKAPHQITVGVVDKKVLPNRQPKLWVDVPDTRQSVQQAWFPRNPAKSQLMGCVDLEKTGGKVVGCKYDDPKPETVEMRQGTYRVRLLEVATGKQLLDKKVTGEDEKCPPMVFLIGEQFLYSQVADRQLYELFRPFVMKK